MNAPLYPTPPSVVAQVASLPTLSMPEIKALWQQLFGTEVAHPQPPISRAPPRQPAAGGCLPQG